MDLDAVSGLFAPHWRAVRALEHVLVPDVGPRASYVLAHGDDPGRRTLGALEPAPDGSGGVRARLLTDDQDVRPALDPARVAPRLADALGRSVGACRATALRWRPGDRGVVRYETDGGDPPTYGKTLATGADALAALLGGLWRATEAPGLPRPPRLLAAWPDWSAVLTAEVRGEDLGRLAVSGAPDDVGDRYAALVARLHAEETAATHGPAVPSHGALRPSHLLLDGDAVGLVDLDGFCLAEPERDVGELLAYLRWRSAKRPADARRVAEADALLLAGYGELRSLDPDRLRRRRAVSLVRLVGRRFAALDVRHWTAAEALLDDVEALLDGDPRLA